MSTTAVPVLHLSLILKSDLVDAAGRKLGRVDDLVVRLGHDEYPPVRGVVARVAGREVFVSAEQLASIEHGRVAVRAPQLDVRPFERRPQEILLDRDVLDRQLINVDGARLVRANEIEVARIDGWWRVVGVDVSLRGLARRLLPRRVAPRMSLGTFLDWASIEPFTGHIPTVRLRVPHPKLARLHPAELADLLESASRSESEELLEAIGSDPEREADVFEELEDGIGADFAEERSDAEIAALVARMETDDAADLLAGLSEERREAVLEHLPSVRRRRLRTLLGYDPTTAGGLMSPDFVAVFTQAEVAETLQRLRHATAPPEALTWVFAVNTHRRYRGAIPIGALLRAEPGSRVTDLVTHQRSVRPEAELEEIARLMADYDLTILPVTSEHDEILGVVSVDDVLELILPGPWRRRFGFFGGE
ncbi:MAG: magnesium transporter [Thermoleophilia bacterium]|nr:magnesium transporter [Thermoleophilia bacterium]